MIADLAMQRALDRFHKVGNAGLTDEERTLATLWFFEAKVANSGFAAFFESEGGVFAPQAPAAFRAIGAPALADLAERANAVFDQEGISPDPARRAGQVSALPEEAQRTLAALEAQYIEFDRDLDERIERFLTEHARAVR